MAAAGEAAALAEVAQAHDGSGENSKFKIQNSKFEFKFDFEFDFEYKHRLTPQAKRPTSRNLTTTIKTKTKKIVL